MSQSTRFAVSLLLLAELARARPDSMTSAALAESAGAHPVVVRRLLGRLARAGLTEAKAGKDGGARLALAPKRISLRAVYAAVENGALISRGTPEGGADGAEQTLAPSINRACRKAEKAFFKALEGMTLKDVMAGAADAKEEKAA